MNKRISIKKGKRLINKWNTIVSYLVESPYKGKFYIDDYLHWMDTRESLEFYLFKLKRNARSELIPLVEMIDTKLKSITEPSDCIWSVDNKKIYNWDPSKYWWLFRKPKDIPKGHEWGWDKIKYKN
jgi:hypothetical protein